MGDIIIGDNLSEMKLMLLSPAFKSIEQVFQKEKQRLLSKMLNAQTSDQETLGLKAAINVMEAYSPAKIGEGLLNRSSKKTKNRYPELFR
jgi:hypothetical protein